MLAMEVWFEKGAMFYVDIAGEACLRRGFSSMDQVVTPFRRSEVVTILGVAMAPYSGGARDEDVMWFEKEDGCIGFFGPGNLREAGFRAVSDVPAEELEKIRASLTLPPKEETGNAHYQ